MEVQGEQVCLLIDFENLVYGLRDKYGEDDFANEVDINLLLKLAEEYGQVVLANAYADWRSRDVNQFQIDLYRLGIELVHVLARRRKNAVDVKMAVDAIETLWSLPTVQTYVIVSGDRDFIHVLKALRKRGKTVVGVAPAESTSEDFAALCDRFLRYSALAATYSAAGPAASPQDRDQMEELRSALRRILAEYGEEGLKGAKIKPLLRREFSATFDESEYGFAKMTPLLRAMPEVARVETAPDGGDILVFPVDNGQDAEGAPQRSRDPETSAEKSRDDMIYNSGLHDYRFERNARRRHNILKLLHAVMMRRGTFTWREITEEVLESTDASDLNLSVTSLSKYFTMFWQSYVFLVLPDQEGIALKDRKLQLKPEYQKTAEFIWRYEVSAVFKVVSKSPRPVTAKSVALLLGYKRDEEKSLARCAKILAEASKS